MRLAARLVGEAIDFGIISKEEQELYVCILCTMGFSAITWATLLILGYLFGCLPGCLVFLVLYLPLRIFAGGLHCNNRRNCYILSVVIFAVMIFTYHMMESASYIWFDYLLYISVAVIIIMAPVQDKNKPLECAEARHHRRTALKILMVEIILLLGMNLLFQNRLSKEIIFFSTVPYKLLALQLILGAAKNKWFLSAHFEE